jgi:2'-5' RNA ligase
MDQKRVFIAIDISEAARLAVKEHITKLRELYPNTRARWVSAANLHLTMRFIGNVNAEVLKDLDEQVQAAARGFEEFRLTLSGTGNFGGRRSRTDTLWIGARAGGEVLKKIAAALEDAPTRNFVPHLTVARIKDAVQARPLIEAHLSSGFRAPSFIVRELTLYESTLTPKGPAYSVLSRHSLGTV